MGAHLCPKCSQEYPSYYQECPGCEEKVMDIKSAEEIAEKCIVNGSLDYTKRNIVVAILSRDTYWEGRVKELEASNFMLESAVNGANQMMRGYDQDIDWLKAREKKLVEAIRSWVALYLNNAKYWPIGEDFDKVQFYRDYANELKSIAEALAEHQKEGEVR